MTSHILERSPDLLRSLSDTVLGSDLGLTVSIALSVLMYLGLVRAVRSGGGC